MLYANYIRNKMHHLVKSVFASGYPLKIISKFKKKAVSYTIHGKTEIGKNLIPYPYMYTTRTVNGVTYTDNGDGSVTVSGTATGYSDFFFKIMSIAPNTTFTFSKNQSDDAANMAFVLRQLDENRALVGTEISLIPTVATHTFTTAENARYIQIACKRYGNVECKGTYKPMLELGDTATEYEKYTVYGIGDKTKNLIPYPYSGFGGKKQITTNGVTYTDNSDGTVTVNGTATADAYLVINDNLKNIDITKKYVLSGSSDISVDIALYQDNTWKRAFHSRNGNPVILDFPSYTDIEYNLIIVNTYVPSGKTVNNVTIKPQLEVGSTATEYEPYGYKIPLVNSGKNLLPYPYYQTTKTINGITFTDNGDGSITANGTATAQASFTCSISPIPRGICSISGCPSGGSNLTYHMWMNATKNGTGKGVTDIGAGGVLDTSQLDYNTSRIYCIVENGTTVNNLVFKPMLELAAAATEYEPYRVPDTTNVYHSAQLKDGESISYKADGLPELQLYKGENNITADTAIKPSAIDVKYLN